MTYSIAFSPPAEKQFGKLEKGVQERILASLDRIKARPYDFVKKLAGRPYYRFRVGDYRLILDIRNEILLVIVIDVGHRKNIYK